MVDGVPRTSSSSLGRASPPHFKAGECSGGSQGCWEQEHGWDVRSHKKQKHLKLFDLHTTHENLTRLREMWAMHSPHTQTRLCHFRCWKASVKFSHPLSYMHTHRHRHACTLTVVCAPVHTHTHTHAPSCFLPLMVIWWGVLKGPPAPPPHPVSWAHGAANTQGHMPGDTALPALRKCLWTHRSNPQADAPLTRLPRVLCVHKTHVGILL